MTDQPILALMDARIMTGDATLEGHSVLVRGGRILDVVTRGAIPALAERQDLKGLLVAPGLIDLQVNGGGDALFNDAPNVASIVRMGAAHARFGTTRFLPTLITTTFETMRAGRDAAREALGNPASGALGIHFEGPFLNPARKGVHQPAFMREPAAAMNELFEPMPGGSVLVTLAPEQVPAGFIASLVKRGVKVAAGHSEAGDADMARARGEGLSLFTHLFNAMAPMTARTPGVTGAALSDDGAWCSIIADGHHVHDDLMRIALRAKPPGKLLLVSDAMPPVGGHLPAFMLDGRPIRTEHGRCVTSEGVLAGSAIALLEAVRYCVRRLALPVDEALRMASGDVADFLGLRGRFGRIAPGHHADLIVLDKNLKLTATLRDGFVVHGALP